MKKQLATLAVIAAAIGFAASSTEAAPGPVVTGGLVNVTLVDLVDIGDVQVAVQNVGIGVAANVAAQICGLEVGNIGVLAQQVARQGQATACTIQDQDAHNTAVQIAGANQ